MIENFHPVASNKKLETFFVVSFITLSAISLSSCIFYESPSIKGEISDEFGNIVQFNHSTPSQSILPIYFDLNSEIIKVKVKNEKTGEPIKDAFIRIVWDSHLTEEYQHRSNTFILYPWMGMAEGRTDQNGEVTFSKSRAIERHNEVQKNLGKNNSNMNLRITQIYISIFVLSTSTEGKFYIYESGFDRILRGSL